jgi:hypothetical protein
LQYRYPRARVRGEARKRTIGKWANVKHRKRECRDKPDNDEPMNECHARIIAQSVPRAMADVARRRKVAPRGEMNG